MTAEHTIVVGIDCSPASKTALRWAIDEARRRQASVVAVHAWREPTVAYDTYSGTSVPLLTPDDVEKVAHERAAATVAEVVGDDLSVPVTVRVCNGHAARQLVDASAGADLLVVGSHGHGGFAGMLLGSVSTHVLHHARCPVVVVRPDWTP
jgi:nucleotide-binding universal stress UspA family protein